jgi:hypothetical protein
LPFGKAPGICLVAIFLLTFRIFVHLADAAREQAGPEAKVVPTPAIVSGTVIPASLA